MKASHKIASLTLAAIFLFSSLGFTISSMVCLKSGKGKVSLALIEDCCAKKNASAASVACCDEEEEVAYPSGMAVLKKGECCDISNYSFQLTDYQNASKLSLEQPAFTGSLFHSAEVVPLSSFGNKLSFQYTDLPPPLYGRSLLNFISILTI